MRRRFRDGSASTTASAGSGSGSRSGSVVGGSGVGLGEGSRARERVGRDGVIGENQSRLRKGRFLALIVKSPRHSNSVPTSFFGDCFNAS